MDSGTLQMKLHESNRDFLQFCQILAAAHQEYTNKRWPKKREENPCSPLSFINPFLDMISGIQNSNSSLKLSHVVCVWSTGPVSTAQYKNAKKNARRN